jgi:predicted cupin superfamily sugar epimerase
VSDRAEELAAVLGLAPHPEGGRYREVHRSTERVRPLDGRTDRAALTSIHFLLAEGEVSRWHRVRSDEAWHFAEGAPLELLTMDADFARVRRWMLGTADAADGPLRVVPAGCWQAARPTGAYTLVGCTVGPGFDFADFALLRDLPREAETLRARHPAFAALL